MPVIEKINKIKREESRSKGPGSAKEKSVADPYSGYVVLSTGAAFKLPSSDTTDSYLWAIKQILDSSSCTFAYPRSYVLNNR
jgi:hypothetical protein